LRVGFELLEVVKESQLGASDSITIAQTLLVENPMGSNAHVHLHRAQIDRAESPFELLIDALSITKNKAEDLRDDDRRCSRRFDDSLTLTTPAGMRALRDARMRHTH